VNAVRNLWNVSAARAVRGPKQHIRPNTTFSDLGVIADDEVSALLLILIDGIVNPRMQLPQGQRTSLRQRLIGWWGPVSTDWAQDRPTISVGRGVYFRADRLSRNLRRWCGRCECRDWR
jgi:hypothetical protein